MSGTHQFPLVFKRLNSRNHVCSFVCWALRSPDLQESMTHDSNYREVQDCLKRHCFVPKPASKAFNSLARLVFCPWSPSWWRSIDSRLQYWEKTCHLWTKGLYRLARCLWCSHDTSPALEMGGNWHDIPGKVDPRMQKGTHFFAFMRNWCKYRTMLAQKNSLCTLQPTARSFQWKPREWSSSAASIC